MSGNPPIWFAEDHDEDDLGDEETYECHMGQDGFCQAAGSEFCEIRCPYRDM